MFRPPSSNQPSPPQGHRPDDRLAVVVAFGTLAGLAGWLVVGGFPFIDHKVTRSWVVSEEAATLPETAPSPISPAPPVSPAETERRDTAPQAPVGDDQWSHESAEADIGDRAITEPDIPPVPALPPMPSSDGAPLPPPPEVTSEPSPDSSLIVPAPKIPVRERTGDLAVIRPALSFTDIPEGFWAKPYIDELTARGVLSGLPAGRFEPNRPMTRAELAAQIAQAFALEPQRANKNFADITRDDWAATPIQEAVTTGFMTGYPQGVFQPNTTLTRLQVLVALATGLSLPETNQPERLIGQYQDAAAVPDWARAQVAAAIAAGIISPSAATNNQLRPNAPATRAEVAALIYGALAYMGKVQPLE